MSKQKLLTTLWVCLALIYSVTLFAQDDACPLSPPTDIWVTEVSSAMISVEWIPVPGTVNYQVTTKHTDSGAIIDVAVTSGLQYTLNGLNDNTNYTIEVRASACQNGPWGVPIAIEKTTSIIIVDIVLHLECDETSGPQNMSYMPGDKIISTFPSWAKCALIEGSLPTFNHETFSVVIKPKQSSNSVIAGLVSANNSSNIRINQSNKVFVEYEKSATINETFIEIETVFMSGGQAPEINVLWEKEVDMAGVIFCDICEFATGTKVSESGGNARLNKTYGLKIAPNPAGDHIRVEAMDEAAVIEVFDLQGRFWHNQVASSSSISIDVSPWPSGIYCLRTLVNGEPLVQKFSKI